MIFKNSLSASCPVSFSTNLLYLVTVNYSLSRQTGYFLLLSPQQLANKCRKRIVAEKSNSDLCPHPCYVHYCECSKSSRSVLQMRHSEQVSSV